LADESYVFDDVYQNADVPERMKNGTSKFQSYIPIHLVRNLIDHIAVLTQQYITCISTIQCIFQCFELKCIMESNIYMFLRALIKKKEGIPK
jgi:hypothetical protein